MATVDELAARYAAGTQAHLGHEIGYARWVDLHTVERYRQGMKLFRVRRQLAAVARLVGLVDDCHPDIIATKVEETWPT
jgi:hypothetical protein